MIPPSSFGDTAAAANQKSHSPFHRHPYIIIKLPLFPSPKRSFLKINLFPFSSSSFYGMEGENVFLALSCSLPPSIFLGWDSPIGIKEEKSLKHIFSKYLCLYI